MRSERYEPFRNEFTRTSDREARLQRELGAVASYIELDEIQLIHRYDEIHALEQLPLSDQQFQAVAAISNALLERIEHKISPGFRQQLEAEAQQTNFQEDPMYGRSNQHQY